MASNKGRVYLDISNPSDSAYTGGYAGISYNKSGANFTDGIYYRPTIGDATSKLDVTYINNNIPKVGIIGKIFGKEFTRDNRVKDFIELGLFEDFIQQPQNLYFIDEKGNEHNISKTKNGLYDSITKQEYPYSSGDKVHDNEKKLRNMYYNYMLNKFDGGNDMGKGVVFDLTKDGSKYVMKNINK